MADEVKVTIEIFGERAERVVNAVRAAQVTELRLGTITAQLEDILQRITSLNSKEVTSMAKLEEVLAVITPLKTKVEGLNALMDAMRQKIADLLAGEIVPPALQGKIDAVFAEAKGLSDEITTAVDENTEPAPPPVEPPVEPPVDGQV